METRPNTPKEFIYDFDWTISSKTHLHEACVAIVSEVLPHRVPLKEDQIENWTPEEVDLIWNELLRKYGEDIKPTGSASEWNRIFKANLNYRDENGTPAHVSIASFNSFKPIIERYMERVIGLEKEDVNKIRIEAWLPKNARVADKYLHFDRIIQQIDAPVNEDQALSDLERKEKYKNAIIADDTDRIINDVIDKIQNEAKSDVRALTLEGKEVNKEPGYENVIYLPRSKTEVKLKIGNEEKTIFKDQGNDKNPVKIERAYESRLEMQFPVLDEKNKNRIDGLLAEEITKNKRVTSQVENKFVEEPKAMNREALSREEKVGQKRERGQALYGKDFAVRMKEEQELLKREKEFPKDEIQPEYLKALNYLKLIVGGRFFTNAYNKLETGLLPQNKKAVDNLEIDLAKILLPLKGHEVDLKKRVDENGQDHNPTVVAVNSCISKLEDFYKAAFSKWQSKESKHIVSKPTEKFNLFRKKSESEKLPATYEGFKDYLNSESEINKHHAIRIVGFTLKRFYEEHPEILNERKSKNADMLDSIQKINAPSGMEIEEIQRERPGRRR